MFYLMSIKPKYTELILKGKKTVEVRRTHMKISSGDTVVMYATKPVGKVVGYFVVKDTVWKEKSELWHLIKKKSCLSNDEYSTYAINSEMMFAIAIDSVTPVDGLNLDTMTKPVPQSYRRISESEYYELCCMSQARP